MDEYRSSAVPEAGEAETTPPRRQRPSGSTAAETLQRLQFDDTSQPGNSETPTPPRDFLTRPSTAPPGERTTFLREGMDMHSRVCLSERVKKSGWLLKAFGGSSLRTWKRRWVYLLDDRLCWAPEEGSVAEVRYISLDRIPVRPAATGYGPDLGVTLVDSGQFTTSPGRIGCMFGVTSGSKTHHFCADDPGEAEGWVQTVKSAWQHCVTHASRAIHTSDPEELQIHREQKLMSQNLMLRSTVANLTEALDHVEGDATRRLDSADGEIGRLEMMLTERVKYKIQVQTGICKGSSTDARVYIELFGRADSRSSGTIQLIDTQENRAPFNKGQLDTFVVDCVNLGYVAELKLWHDGSGRRPHWFCESVRVTCLKNSHKHNFPCRQWFSTKTGDRRIMRTLYSGRLASPAEYQIRVFTSDRRGAATDANVHVVLHGEKGSSGRHILSCGPDDFERGARNEFHIEDIEVGRLKGVTIGHDNSGYAPSWHLDHLVVANLKSGQQFLVPGRCWLALGHEDGLLERELPVAPELEPNVEYTISCVTADVRGASTDADVYVILHGTKSDSGRIFLPSSPDDFERNTKSSFSVEAPYVGELTRLTIGHNNKGIGPSWRLDYVEVTEQPGGKATWFSCGNWLSSSLADRMTERTLVPTNDNPEQAREDYEVAICTSRLKGAGTDATVYLSLHGKQGSSGVFRLHAPLSAFARGSTDKFDLSCKDIGLLERVVIGHDNTGRGPCWHLDKVMATAKRTGKAITFPCRRWLSKEVGDRLVERELHPEGHEDTPSFCTWEFSVVTSDRRGASTDANVFIELAGALGSTGPLRLDSEASNFERGKQDRFVIDNIDVGDLEGLTVWHDGSGFAPSWHLQLVEVTNQQTGRTWWFLANTWLSDKDGCKVTLKPSRDNPGATMQTYKVLVRTGDLKGAGTDAGVTLEIIGSLQSTGPRQLVAEHDTFERNGCDEFQVRAHDLGRLQQVLVRSDGQGHGSSWYLEQVDIISEGGDATFFPAGQWLRGSDLEVVLDATAVDPRESLVEYDVSVRTSDVPRAGTDSNVFVQVIGSTGHSGEIQLHSKNRDAWQRAQVDECHPIKLSVGIPDAIRVWHDNQGMRPAWHLDTIALRSQRNGAEYFFPCNAWLDEEAGLERQLRATQTDPASRMKDYEVSVVTSDIRGAGTDAAVSIDLHGHVSSSGPMRLENGSHEDPFERGQTDVFTITCPALGEIKTCTIGHNSRGAGSSWHLAHAKVTEKDSGRVSYFHCDQWLDRNSKDGLTMRTLEASSVDPSKSQKVYKVRVHTSDCKGAGTDARVFITLVGSAGDTGKRALVAKGLADFERGKVDEFELKGEDIGRLERVRVGHDNSGTGASWHCKRVEVMGPGADWVSFPCSRWLSAKEDDGAIERDLYPEGSANALKENTYQIVVRTSDLKGAGTDSAVFVELCGASGSTGPLRLDDSRDNFERGQVDRFTVTASDVGPVKKLRVWTDGKGLGAAWHLELIEVVNEGAKTTHFFECKDWFDSAHGLKKTLEASTSDPSASMTSYRIVVHTSDLRGAGTDAAVWIDLRGSDGTTGKVPLGNRKNNFERASVDEFVQKLRSVGALQSLEIGHDGSGLGAAWHLEQVEITDMGSGQVCFFDARLWLDSKNGTHRQLQASASNPKSALCKYKVSVKTSDKRQAGTDAQVHIYIYGERGDSGKQILDNSRDNFERNQLDTFFLQLHDLGKLNKIRLGHDNSSLGPGWHCDTVEISNSSTGEHAAFRVNSWFDKTMGDGQIEREFALGKASQPTSLEEYSLIFQTGDARGAGTDADVAVTLFGSKGSFGPYAIPASAEHFERGRTDTFAMSAEDVGDIQQLEVAQNGKGMGAAWLLDSVEVVKQATGERVFFPCNSWLDKKHGMSKLLSPGAPPLQGQKAQQHESPAPPERQRQVYAPRCWPYTVKIVTSDVPGGGNIRAGFINILSSNLQRETGRLELRPSRGHFVAGDSELLKLESPELVKNMTHVELGHSEAGGSWHVESVTVTSVESRETIFVPCKRWLAKGQDDGATVRTFRAARQAGQETDYEITVHTGGASTINPETADAFCNLIGSERATGRLGLTGQGHTVLSEGSRAAFSLYAQPDVGVLEELELGLHNSTGVWHVLSVEVHSVASGGRAVFYADAMLTPQQPVVQLVASRDESDADPGSANASLTQALTGSQIGYDPPQTLQSGYQVTFQTKRSMCSGTEGAVSFDLIGHRGSSGRIHVQCNKNSFSRGGSSSFVFPKLPFLGQLSQIRVHLTPKSMGLISAGWELESVTVTHLSSKETWYFYYGGWIGKQVNYEVTLSPDEQPATAPLLSGESPLP